MYLKHSFSKNSSNINAKASGGRWVARVIRPLHHQACIKYEPCVGTEYRTPFGGWWSLHWSHCPEPSWQKIMWRIVASENRSDGFMHALFQNISSSKNQVNQDWGLFQSNKDVKNSVQIFVILGAHWNLIQTSRASCRWTFIILQKVIRCHSFLVMPTMTQSGSCIDPCKEIYSPGSRCRLKVFEILLRLLFFPSFPPISNNFKEKIPAHLSLIIQTII